MGYEKNFDFMSCFYLNLMMWAGVSINRATVAELEGLPHIGHVKAVAIGEYRETHGPFVAISDLVKVKGVGEKTLEKIKDQLEL